VEGLARVFSYPFLFRRSLFSQGLYQLLNLTILVALRSFLVKNAGYLGVSYPFKDAARELEGGTNEHLLFRRKDLLQVQTKPLHLQSSYRLRSGKLEDYLGDRTLEAFPLDVAFGLCPPALART
jgi:hypothetical protein